MNAKYLLLIFFSVFALLFWGACGHFAPFCNKPTFKNINDSLEKCKNTLDIQSIWEKPEYSNLKKDTFFYNAVAKKLASLPKEQQNVAEIRTWFPAKKTNINLIVIPDLSKRITDIPNQMDEDIIVLDMIWSIFKDSLYASDCNHSFLIDITNQDKDEELGNIFRKIAYMLTLNTERLNDKIKETQLDSLFKTNIRSLYNQAKFNPLGADYPNYFVKQLPHRIIRNTITDDYKNKIIIITDGYLEVQDPNNIKIINSYTPVKETKNQLEKNDVAIKNISAIQEYLNNNFLNIQDNWFAPNFTEIDLQNANIMILEMYERQGQKDIAFPVLVAFWKNWLQFLKANPKIDFERTKQSDDILSNNIRAFIKN